MPCCWECCHLCIHDNQSPSINTSVSWRQWCPSWTRPADSTCSDYCRWSLTFTPWWVKERQMSARKNECGVWGWRLVKVSYSGQQKKNLKVTKGVEGWIHKWVRIEWFSIYFNANSCSTRSNMVWWLTPLAIPYLSIRQTDGEISENTS